MNNRKRSERSLLVVFIIGLLAGFLLGRSGEPIPSTIAHMAGVSGQSTTSSPPNSQSNTPHGSTHSYTDPEPLSSWGLHTSGDSKPAIVNPLVRLMNQLGYVIVAVRGVMQLINGTISIGDIQAFIQYVNQVSEPITEISYTINSLQGAIVAAERVFELLDEEEEAPDPAVPTLPEQPEGNICFDHIRFGYSDDKILMKDVSIDIKAGNKVAIVGPTGAGKTTLVNLLMRFYDLKGGRILPDGVDIEEMGRGELRALTAMVLQESWLFGGTIKENIAYGHEGASDEAVFQAAKAACADHFIRTLPLGYDTVLSDEINTLSQGQRQILTIARAILADPMILILDEATSSVDTKTELDIQKAMSTLMKGRTSFVIAHRLSTIQDADCILVMNNGSIIEQGTHDELMQKNGFYADLYNSQFTL